MGRKKQGTKQRKEEKAIMGDHIILECFKNNILKTKPGMNIPGKESTRFRPYPKTKLNKL